MADKVFRFATDPGITMVLTIERKSDGAFWTGTAWQVGAATVAMTETASYSTNYSQYSSTTAPTAPCWWKANADSTTGVLYRDGEFSGSGVSVDSTAGSWPPSLADVHTYLNLKTATDDQDALLDLVRVKAKDAIEEYCQRQFASASRTFVLNGNGSVLLPIPQYPITTITSVKYDISAPRSWDTTISSDLYQVLNGQSDQHDEGKHSIELIDGSLWYEARSNYQIVATVGYSTIPNNLYQGCMELILHMFFRASNKTIGLTNRSEQGGSVGYDLEAGLMPSVVRGLINPFRSIRALGYS